MNIRLMAVGDIMLGDQPLCQGFGVRNNLHFVERKDVEPVSNLLSKADLVFGNLEAPISDNSNRKVLESNYFLAAPSAINLLNSFGFNILSIANNHICEHGPVAFNDTIELLENSGITPIGIKDKISHIKIGNIVICFMAFSMIEDDSKSIGYNMMTNTDQIHDIILECKKNSDIIIAVPHWGVEYIPFPTPKQVEIGRNMVKMGVDIIIGGHPHVLQGYEYYDNKLIIYSLGNFVFDHTFINEASHSAIADISISERDINLTFHTITIKQENKFLPSLTHSDFNTIEHLNNVAKLLGSFTMEEYDQWFTDNQESIFYKRKLAKREMKTQFVKNIYRYPFRFSINQIVRVIKKVR